MRDYLFWAALGVFALVFGFARAGYREVKVQRRLSVAVQEEYEKWCARVGGEMYSTPDEAAVCLHVCHHVAR